MRRPTWEELYQAASPAQQRELLGLAEQQGILYGDQLPEIPTLSGNVGSPALAQILKGSVSSLQPFHAAPVSVMDRTLDDCQREAVAKALSTPDICVVQGEPGTGRKQVSAEIITQAIVRGQCVLLLASTAKALDAILESLAMRQGILSVRCLDQGETAESLPPAIASMTFPARLSLVNGKAHSAARIRTAELERRLTRLRQNETFWSKLDSLSRNIAQLNEASRVLELERAGVVTALNQQIEKGEIAGSLADRIGELGRIRAEACRALDAALSRLKSETASDRERLTALQADVGKLRTPGCGQGVTPMVDASLVASNARQRLEAGAGPPGSRTAKPERPDRRKGGPALALSEERKATESKFESAKALLVDRRGPPVAASD